MKQVWKCDFCFCTDIKSEKILEHEKECSFSPFLKKCWTCKYHDDVDEWGYPENICYKKMSLYDGDEGQCIEWKTNDEKFFRKLKLKRLEQ